MLAEIQETPSSERLAPLVRPCPRLDGDSERCDDFKPFPELETVVAIVASSSPCNSQQVVIHPAFSCAQHPGAAEAELLLPMPPPRMSTPPYRGNGYVLPPRTMAARLG